MAYLFYLLNSPSCFTLVLGGICINTQKGSYCVLSNPPQAGIYMSESCFVFVLCISSIFAKAWSFTQSVRPAPATTFTPYPSTRMSKHMANGTKNKNPNRSILRSGQRMYSTLWTKTTSKCGVFSKKRQE